MAVVVAAAVAREDEDYRVAGRGPRLGDTAKDVLSRKFLAENLPDDELPGIGNKFLEDFLHIGGVDADALADTAVGRIRRQQEMDPLGLQRVQRVRRQGARLATSTMAGVGARRLGGRTWRTGLASFASCDWASVDAVSAKTARKTNRTTRMVATPVVGPAGPPVGKGR